MEFDVGAESQAKGNTNKSSSLAEGSHQRSKNTSLKRKSNAKLHFKPKKRKVKAIRQARPSYTVEEGEDMLLVISDPNRYVGLERRPKKKRTKKKKIICGKARPCSTKKKSPLPTNNLLLKKTEQYSTPSCSDRSLDHRWGQSLPEELLVNIFQIVVRQDGAVPFLCRMARVCRLWNTTAASPMLWRSVSLGYCWIDPGKTQLSKTEQKIKETFNWLAQNRFSLLKDFSLNHWKKNVDYAIEVLSKSCSHLHSLKLSYCTGITEKAFQGIAAHSRFLSTINLQYSEFQVDGLVTFLESCGNQIRQILFSYGSKNDRLLAAIYKGLCPNLELLEINTKLDSGFCQLPICIQALQSRCPKLKTFRMLNVIPMPKVMRNGPDAAVGFPLLEELCLATTSISFMTDKDLRDILFGSTKLRVLDLRGCSRITPDGLVALPCEELECFFWGLYYNSATAFPAARKGLHMLTQKWCGTLQELDITNHVFTEEDLEVAVGHLTHIASADLLRSLNLSGTKITINALRLLIGQSTALNYLNLSSCRYLPRGLKKIYRGQDIQQLLDKLE